MMQPNQPAARDFDPADPKSADQQSVPVIRRLDARWSGSALFERLRHLPGCLWLDSAPGADVIDDPMPSSNPSQARYSFLTAAPVAWLRRRIPAADQSTNDKYGVAPNSGWPDLQNWMRYLPDRIVETQNGVPLPPFQGGIAGLIGYEAGAWLEPTGISRENDLPTDTIAMGLYDVVFAIDHLLGEGWIFSQGFQPSSVNRSLGQATERAGQFMDWLHNVGESPPESALRETPTQRHAARKALPANQAHDPVSSVELESNFTSDQFVCSAQDIINRICRGDSFQVNLAQRLTVPASCSSTELYQHLRDRNPAPYSGYFDAGGFQVISSSPEGFLRVKDREVETRPIKGTVPRTGNKTKDRDWAKQLRDSEKDRAENVMIVDLMRNDLSRVCEDDSIVVKQLCRLESYQFVQHLVSVIRGRLRDELTIVDLLMACFPGGSVTGAPKIEAMRTIAELEPHHRGPYCGSLGYITSKNEADFNILIRTITAVGDQWQIPVGGGITARSDPGAELAETWTKAEGMLAAVRGVGGPRESLSSSSSTEPPQPDDSLADRTPSP